jgi:hypothetical protein
MLELVERSTSSEAQEEMAQEEPGMGNPANPRISAPTGMNLCIRDRANVKHHCQGCRGLGLTNTLPGCSGTPQVAKKRSTPESGGPHGRRTDGWAVRDEQP